MSLDRDLDHLRRHKRRAHDFPFKPVGGNVLLRRIKDDSRLLLIETRDNRVLAIGEVIGLGSRWSQDAKWWPPMPTPAPGEMLDGSREVDWKPPDYSLRPASPVPSFTAAHEALLSEVKVGDLVVYSNSRVYDVFRWEGEDLLLYPGTFLHGVVEKTHLADHPKERRYALEPL